MSRKRLKALTMNEIAEELQKYEENSDNNDNDNFGDVIVVPPDVGALTDEKDIADDNMGDVLVQDVPGTLEIHTKGNDQNEAESDRPKPTKKKLCESIPKWKHVSPKYTKGRARDDHDQSHLREMKEALEFSTLVEIFEELMTPEICDYIVKETVHYATTYKNAMDFIMTSNELKAFIGVLLLSSYHKLPSERYYWSNNEDLGISLVKNALSRNHFQMLKSFIHFVDNSEAENNKHDKGFKIRPLYTMLQKSFMKFGIFEENLSFDEMVVRYYGHYSLKQFIRGKPIGFGYKFWVLCGVSGYCYNFDLYCGKATDMEENSDLLLDSKVVLNRTCSL